MKVITFKFMGDGGLFLNFDQVATFSCFHVASSFCVITSCLCTILAHYYASIFSFTSLLCFLLCCYYLPLCHFLLLCCNCFLLSHYYLCSCCCFLHLHYCCTYCLGTCYFTPLLCFISCYYFLPLCSHHARLITVFCAFFIIFVYF